MFHVEQGNAMVDSNPPDIRVNVPRGTHLEGQRTGKPAMFHVEQENGDDRLQTS